MERGYTNSLVGVPSLFMLYICGAVLMEREYVDMSKYCCWQMVEKTIAGARK